MPWRSEGSLWRSAGNLSRLLTECPKRSDLACSVTVHSQSRSYHASPRCRERATHAELLQGLKGQDPKESVRVQGMVRSIRKQKNIAFAAISDGTTFRAIPAVLTPFLAKEITNGSYVDLTGRWDKSLGRGQTHDLQVESVNQIGHCNAEENPMQKQDQGIAFLRSLPHLRIRRQSFSLLTRARNQLMRSVADYFENQGDEPAVQVHPPVITSSDCEGAGEAFTINPATPAIKEVAADEEKDEFFGQPKYLTVSNQLHLEAWSAELGNVWALAPTFRAEPSETPRHLAEFYMLEAEFRGTHQLEDVISQAEGLIRHMTSQLTKHSTGPELLDYYLAKIRGSPQHLPEVDLEDRWKRVLSPEPWRRITYTEAVAALDTAASIERKLFEHKPSWDNGIALEHEKWLVRNISKDHPLVITDYPAAHKPFYMLPNSALESSVSGGGQNSFAAKEMRWAPGSQRATAACFDIIFPYGYAEICGGSLREHRLEPLITTMRSRRMLKSAESESRAQAVVATPDPDDLGDSKSTSRDAAKTASSSASIYPYLNADESLGSLQWYADLRRFGSSPHGGFGIGFDRLMAYLTGVGNIRDVVGFPRGYKHCHC